MESCRFYFVKTPLFSACKRFSCYLENLSVISKSTVISGQDVYIFKHHAVTLSSVLDFWKGKVGFQQYPVMANVGTTAVYTWSGQARPDWNNRNKNNQNIHLPYVAQKKNVALVMYRPEPTPEVLGNNFANKEVILNWQDNDFDEVAEDSLWLLGRQENSYVAVRRNCIGEINSVKACPTPANGGQTWVIVVGDSLMYGSFNNFQNAIQQAEYEESWTYDSTNNTSVYYAKIQLDTISIDYAWEVDSTLNTGIETFNKKQLHVNVYPNPTNNIINISIETFENSSVEIKAFNTVGELVYAETSTINNSQTLKKINTTYWPQGIYLIILESNGNRYIQKVIKAE
jgi:hypothetical protein